MKVVYRPWEEIIIHESILFSLEDLVQTRGLGATTGGIGRQLLWTEGIAFAPIGMPPTDDVVKEQLQGKVHWSGVEWASMPNYQNVFVIKETKVRVPVINVSASPIMRTAAQWLKSQIKEQ